MAVIEGVEKLTGAKVIASDLRGGAALVLACIAAHGESSVDEVKFIERGYEDMCSVLTSLGCDIKEEGIMQNDTAKSDE